MRRFLVKARNRALGVSLIQRSLDDLKKQIDPSAPNTHYCTICGRQAALRPGPDGRADAGCSRCGSLERHRLIWLYLTFETDLMRKPQRVLHFAPERSFRERLKAAKHLDYVTGDLDSPIADVQLDIQDLPFEDASFDVILCSHVLEHIPDDLQAMREIRRVLRPNGWALVDVPLRTGPTYEDPSIVTPEERTKHFGQFDHLRYYGPDIEERLVEAGFTVKVERYWERMDEHLRRHFQVNDETLFICTRSA